eukprot:TRINITY_DN1707_c0_g1_i13.p1 TRINITY_DN1707_c0_g1~~TRINITY_DN1707_c0_g1_i13.p1  ORF type:complete len:1215 (-),score=252.26 TRINITY_DN1707_c0_g1_i13:1461-5105(-)
MLLKFIFFIFYLVIHGVHSQVVGSVVTQELSSALKQGTDVSFAYLERNASDLDSGLQIMAGVIAPTLQDIVAEYHDDPQADPTAVAAQIGSEVDAALGTVLSIPLFSGLDIDSIQGEIFATVSNALFDLTESNVLEVAQVSVINSVITAIGNGIAEITGRDFTFQANIDSLDDLPSNAERILKVSTVKEPVVENSGEVPSSQSQTEAPVDISVLADLESGDTLSVIQYIEEKLQNQEANSVVQFFIRATFDPVLSNSLVIVMEALFEEPLISSAQFAGVLGSTYSQNPDFRVILGETILLAQGSQNIAGLVDLLANVLPQPSLARDAFLDALDYAIAKSGCPRVVDVLSGTRQLLSDGNWSDLLEASNSNGQAGVFECFEQAETTLIILDITADISANNMNSAYNRLVKAKTADQVSIAEIALVTALELGDFQQLVELFSIILTGDEISIPVKASMVNRFIALGGEDAVEVIKDSMAQAQSGSPELENVILYAFTEATSDISNTFVQVLVASIVNQQCSLATIIFNTMIDIVDQQVTSIVEMLVQGGAEICLPIRFQSIGKSVETPVPEKIAGETNKEVFNLPSVEVELNNSFVLPSVLDVEPLPPNPLPSAGVNEVQEFAPTTNHFNMLLPQLQSTTSFTTPVIGDDEIPPTPSVDEVDNTLGSPSPADNQQDMQVMPPRDIPVTTMPPRGIPIATMPPRGIPVTTILSPLTFSSPPQGTAQADPTAPSFVNTAQTDPTPSFVTSEDIYVAPAVAPVLPAALNADPTTPNVVPVLPAALYADPTAPRNVVLPAEQEEGNQVVPIPEPNSLSLQDITQVLAQAPVPAPEPTALSLQDITQILAEAVVPTPEFVMPSLQNITQILAQASAQTSQTATEKSKARPQQTIVVPEEVAAPSPELLSPQTMLSDIDVEQALIEDILQKTLMQSPVVSSTPTQKSPSRRRRNRNRQSPQPQASPFLLMDEITLEDSPVDEITVKNSPMDEITMEDSPVDEIMMKESPSMLPDVETSEDIVKDVISLIAPPTTTPKPAATSNITQVVPAPSPTAPPTSSIIEECVDIPPDSDYTCEEQYKFGKCARKWMQQGNFCAKTCGFCPLDCTNIQPTDKITCEQHRELGLCNETSVIQGDFCRSSCGRCDDFSNALSETEEANRITSLGDAGRKTYQMQGDNNSKCTDVQPAGSPYTCEEQKSFGKCDFTWMISDDYCAKTCGRCS